MLKEFWERKRISQHFEKTIPDHRNQDLITYSKQSIMMAALSIFLFRTGSGNKFDNKSHDNDEKYSIWGQIELLDFRMWPVSGNYLLVYCSDLCCFCRV